MPVVLAPGQTLGRYRILEVIGAGGMGVVYRAHDERLDRDVALKMLPPGSLGDEAARKRFRNEALTLSKLNHPNIAVVYDFDTVDDRDFLVMEYVTGRPLSQKINKGPLPEQEVAIFGDQIALALEDAHEIGIIHRDLKPANIMVTPKGRIKLLDFGLAKLLTPSPVDLTRSLSADRDIAGTLPYMAPEQLRGEQVDRRTDVYAAGAVIYEMATGGPPHEGKTSPLLIAAILNQAPRSPSRPGRKISSALEAIIVKALAKDPERRYQTARELRVDLVRLQDSKTAGQLSAPKTRLGRNRWQAGIIASIALVLAVLAGHRFFSSQLVSSGPVTLAVLPFRSLSAQDEVGSLGLGIADTIITKLASVSRLRLRPTSSIVRYEKGNVDPRDSGRALKTDYVVVGTVQSNANRYRINTQLVRVSDGAPVWGQDYDLARSDLLTLEDAVAEKIAAGLRIKISTAERTRLYRRYTQNPEAYELYLKGRAALPRLTEESTKEAIQRFESALQLDPNYSLAHAGLAMASATMRIRFAAEGQVKSWEDRAREEAQRAIELDSDLAEAHEALAAVSRTAEFDWARVIAESNRALELNPNLDMPHFYRAAAFYHLGVFEQTESEVRAGQDINPLNRAEPLRLRGTAALFSGRFGDAERSLTELRAVSGAPVSDWYLAMAVYYNGDHSRAEALLANLHGGAQVERRAQASLASFLAARGQNQHALALLKEVIGGSYMDHHVAYSVGAAYAQLSNFTDAQRWLERAAATGLPCFPWYQRDPLLAPLRTQPEFQRFLGDLEKSWNSARSLYSSNMSSSESH